ncbi:MAG: hypothetical protein IJ222_09890 [Bacteroidales bacterium]|nr:hypothetical protein [Bacteroidales bacterium]
MDGIFTYSKPVTGKNNIGRRGDQTILSNLILNSENVVIYEPPKTGKTSLLQQTFFGMRISGKQFSTAEVSLLNIRDTSSLMLLLGSTIIRSEATTPDEFASMVKVCLPDTHFVFDPASYAATDSVLSLNWDIDEGDIRSIFCLPYRIAAIKGKKCIVVLDEFQNITFLDGWEKILKIFEGVIRDSQKDLCSFIFMGSKVNAMKEIFEQKVFFHRQVNRVRLSEIDSREITDFIVKGFLTSGKVIDRDLMMSVCKRFRGHIWYICHFSSICDHLTKGFITDATLLDALGMLLSIHEPRFREMVGDLTGFQVSLLKATLEGVTKFSSAEVIEHYGLHSSANVRRLKDALCKKEIITFGDNDEPIILDPLFEYWARHYFFNLKDE